MKVKIDPSDPAALVLAIVLTILVAMGVPYVIIWALNTLGTNIQFNFWSSAAIWSLLIIGNIGTGITGSNNNQQ